jgi:hypothetical protein
MQQAQWWDVAAVILSLLSLIVSIWFAFTARSSNRIAAAANEKSDESNMIAQEANTMSQTANAYARESNMIAQRMYESEYVPKISVSLKHSYVILDEDLKTQSYTLVLSAVIMNEGKIPVEFTHAYIANPKTGGAYAFGIASDNSDIKASLPFPEFPYILGARQTFEVPASGDTLTKMLPMLQVNADDPVVIRVVDTLGNNYDTPEWRAGNYMQKRRARITKVTEEES